MASLSIALTTVMLGQPQQPPRLPGHPVAALAAVIDLESHALRQAAVDELAQRDLPLSHACAGMNYR